MERFTYDVESMVLTNDELRGFANIVQNLVHLNTQHYVALMLGANKSPQPEQACDNVQRRARQMWRTAINTEPAE
jgi:hypothetical protein